jgi:hypothetical protein
MDPVHNPLITRPIQTGMEMAMELYPNRQCRVVDAPDRQSGSGLVPTPTRTRSDGPDPLLTLPTWRAKSLQVQQTSHSAMVTNLAPCRAHDRVYSYSTAASPNLANYDYFRVENVLTAFVNLR